MRVGLTLLIVLNIAINLYGASDTHTVQHVRSFDTQSLEQYRSDSDFNYFTESAEVSWWQGFTEWLIGIIQELFEVEDAEFVGSIVYIVIRILLWAVALGAIGLVIYSLYKRGVFGLIARKQQQVNISDDDLLFLQEETNWEKLIQESIHERKYNEAIRFLFLQVLKMLADSNVIELNKTKSIRDYQRELASTYKNKFSVLARYYQYAWFGGIEIDEIHFTEMHSAFLEFNGAINVE